MCCGETVIHCSALPCTIHQPHSINPGLCAIISPPLNWSIGNNTVFIMTSIIWRKHPGWVEKNRGYRERPLKRNKMFSAAFFSQLIGFHAWCFHYFPVLLFVGISECVVVCVCVVRWLTLQAIWHSIKSVRPQRLFKWHFSVIMWFCAL